MPPRSEGNVLIYDTIGTFSQFPFMLAWAITIHKSQGITLDMCKLNIGGSVFEYGQAYVALSRLTSREGLYITSLDISKIRANPKVIQFYKNINI